MRVKTRELKALNGMWTAGTRSFVCVFPYA